MFCNKRCAKCNLQVEYVVQHNTEIKNIKQCVFLAIFDSMLRQEQANIRIQSAIESGRNEQVKADTTINETVAHGFLALVKSLDEKKKEYIEYHQD